MQAFNSEDVCYNALKLEIDTEKDNMGYQPGIIDDIFTGDKCDVSASHIYIKLNFIKFFSRSIMTHFAKASLPIDKKYWINWKMCQNHRHATSHWDSTKPLLVRSSLLLIGLYKDTNIFSSFSTIAK